MWVPRDEMKAANITVFSDDVDGKEEIIRLRFCKECFLIQRDRWLNYDGKFLEWKNRIRESK